MFHVEQNKNVSRGTQKNNDNEKEDFQERRHVPFFGIFVCVYWLLTLPLRSVARLLNVQADRH